MNLSMKSYKTQEASCTADMPLVHRTAYSLQLAWSVDHQRLFLVPPTHILYAPTSKKCEEGRVSLFEEHLQIYIYNPNNYLL